MSFPRPARLTKRLRSAAAASAALMSLGALALLAAGASPVNAQVLHPARPSAPAPTTPKTSSPSGSVPFPSGETPRLLYADSFSGTTLNPIWELYSGPGNAGFGLRSPSAITLDGRGDLVIAATEQNGQVVSGGMALRLDQTYGRYVIRVRTEADPSATTSGAVLTWPQSGIWPRDGESDMYETLANPARTVVQSTVHYGVANRQVRFTSNVDATKWHTITMDWMPTMISFYIDGTLVGRTANAAAVPQVPQHLCLQLDAVNGNRLTHPVKMYVDSVADYGFTLAG
jgi:hypothetical protein